MRHIIVENEVFERFPNFKRGLIIVSQIENAVSNDSISRLLDQEQEKRLGKPLVQHEWIKSWEDIHNQFGSNPNKFPPSMKSLAKRVEKGTPFPFINSVVALFNYISLKYLIPCGGDDTVTIRGNLKLGFAHGNEVFIPLGDTKPDPPFPGEVIYYDDQTLNVMCRRWNWRNGDFSKITPDSKNIVINIDGAQNVPMDIIIQARDELAQLLIRECSAQLETSILHKDQSRIEIHI